MSSTPTSPQTSETAIELRESQKRVLERLKEFASTSSSQRVFILRGYAGTGKTTLMRFLIQYLSEQHIGFTLLASTGRAAKVLSDAVLSDRLQNHTDNSFEAKTIHSCIYTYSGFNRTPSEEEMTSCSPNGQLNLMFAPLQISDRNDTYLYIVDEASMVCDKTENQPNQAMFGTGQLLSDLLAFDKNSNSKFLFVGDPCQLPPVGEATSPALDENYFSPQASYAELTEIIRQKDDSDLITLSKDIRSHVALAPTSDMFYQGHRVWAHLNIGNNRSVVKYTSRSELLLQYVNLIKTEGYDQVVCICRSNKDVNDCNHIVRSSLGYTNPNLPQEGDLLMVIQNNNPTHLVNGDFVSVESCSTAIKERAGLHFVDATVQERASGRRFSTKIMIDTLSSSQPNLNQEQQSRLFIDFFVRMKKLGIKENSDTFSSNLMTDPYLNALRCNFGYAVTCHKAQGGEWERVFLLLPRNIMLNPTQQSYRWLYTAFTRAKKEVHLMNDFYIR